MLTRLSEKDINITINRKNIQLKKSYFKTLFNIFVKRVRILIVVIFVKIELGEKNVKDFFITLIIKLNKEKKLTIINATILNNYFETKNANIEILKKIFANLNI